MICQSIPTSQDVLVFTFITLLIVAIRFTSDLDALDKIIPGQMADLIYCSAQIISVLVFLLCLHPEKP